MAGPAAALGIDVVANITEAQAALAKVQAQLEATAATSESAAAKSAAAWTAAGKKMQTVGKSMTKYITVPAVAAGAVAVKLAMDFDKSMALIQTQAGASASEVKKLSQEVLDFAKSGKTQFSPNDLAQALYSIESAGIHGAKAMDTLKASAKLATVGQADLAETTKALAAAQKTGIKGSADLKKAIGTLNATVGAGQMHMDDLVAALGTGFLSTAKTAGLSLTDVGTALDELTKQGMPAAAAATRLRMTMSLIAAPSTSAAAALKGIGLSSTDMANAMRGKGNILDALQLLQDHLDGLSHTQIQQVLTAAFGGGRSSGAILSMLGNLDDMKKTMGDITANTDKVNESFKKMQEEPSVQLERVWSQMQAVLIDMGNNLIPKLIPLVQKIAGVLNTVITAFTSAPSWVQDFLIGAVVLGPFIRGLGTIVKLYGAIRTAAAGAAVAETASASAGAAGGAGAAAGAGAEAAGGSALVAALPAAGIAVGVAGAIVGLKIANDKLNATMDKAVKQGFQPEGLIHFGSAMDKVKAQIKKVHDATSGLQDARKNERDTAAAEAKAEQHLLDIRQKYGPDSKQAIKAEGQAARATDAHRIAVQKLQLANRLQGVERKIEERDLVRAAAQQRQQIESLRTQRQNILANVHATGIQNMSNKQLEMTQTRLDQIDKQTAQRQKDLNDLKQKAVQEIGPGYAKQLGVELSKQKNYSDQLKATSKSNQILNDATDSSTQHIHRFTGTVDGIKKWSSDVQGAFQDVMDKNDHLAKNAQQNADKNSQAAQDQRKNVTHSNASMAKDVMNIVGAMVTVVSGKGGFQTLGDNVNSALKALGVSKGISFSIKDVGKAAGSVAGALGLKRGGHVPGQGAGDKVPAMLEPGEFVMNREAVKGIGKARLESMNKALPRFAKGGQVSAMQAMINEANQFESHHFPYAWGGGHAHFGIEPVDCSGFVSDVLHAGGLLNTPMVSGSLMNWGKSGKGPLTVYANPEHTFMSLNGRYAGTSASNPGGGAGWVEGGYPSSYLAGFAARTMDVAGGVAGAAVKQIARVMLEGPKGPLTDMGQRSLDKVRNAANAYIAKKTPSGKFGGGQAMADLGTKGWHKTGATQEGLDGQQGAYGTVGGMGFAELLLAGANAGMHPNVEDIIGKRIPPLGKLGFRYGNKQAIAIKNDIGSGQAGNPHFTVDIQTGLQNALGWHPNADVEVKALQRGGMIPSFASGGKVPGPIGQPRVVVAHGGEDITPANKPARYQITITNWKQGTGYMEEIADGAVNGQQRFGNQMSRMSRA